MKIFFILSLLHTFLFILSKKPPIRIPLKHIEIVSPKFPIIKEIDIYKPTIAEHETEKESNDFRFLAQT